MKKLTLQSLAAVLLATTILFSSCAKEGPQGPQGETGAQGAKGDKGDQGDPANVFYSDWKDVTFDPETATTNGVLDTLAWSATLSAPLILEEVLTAGDIKVYLNAGTAASPAVFALPITDLYALTGVLNINLYYTVGEITFYSTEDASTFTNNNGDKAWQYRYIVIPGSTAVGRKASAVDWNDYNAVKKYLNLKD
ncbi:MAG: collagen-like protein [Terrimonas sp.]|nr:collagen-like protein [Terrimonas sp.]OJY90581.1 MAG: hypothetical protein BGP13_19335 [Sphingobacteriales bacterium 40-81]